MSFDLSGFDTIVVVWAALAVPVFIYSLVGTDHVGRTGPETRAAPRVAARRGFTTPTGPWCGPGWVVINGLLNGYAVLLDRRRGRA